MGSTFAVGDADDTLPKGGLSEASPAPDLVQPSLDTDMSCTPAPVNSGPAALSRPTEAAALSSFDKNTAALSSTDCTQSEVPLLAGTPPSLEVPVAAQARTR